MNKDNIQPLKGFRDFQPQDAFSRQEVFAKIRSSFMKYGFLPMETPALEYKEILTGKSGEDSDKLLYAFRDRGERDVAMRYDLTVPLARFYSNYQSDLPLPFKRFQIAPVWRADKPQKGRYREFTQCDVDVVGTSSVLSDAEVIACLADTLFSLGISDVLIKVNNRKVLNALIMQAGIPVEKSNDSIRIIDKLDKIGETGVRAELALSGLTQAMQDKLFALLKTDVRDMAEAKELIELSDLLKLMQVKNFQIDLSLARGFDYYTGTIFEIVMSNAPQYGSIAGGGRYDNLIGMFAGQQVPAVGGSIGIDRLMAAIAELDLLKFEMKSGVLICNLDRELETTYLKLAGDLRKDGIRVDLYYEHGRLEKQLKYAHKKNINYAVMIGTDEMKTNQITVKNLSTGKQTQLSQSDLSAFLKQA